MPGRKLSVRAIRGEVGRKLRGTYHLQEMEGTRLLRKKAMSEYSKALDPGARPRDSAFAHASNVPAPTQYAGEAAAQSLRQKPGYARSEYVVDMARQAGGRFTFLLSKPAGDYDLPYHQHVQQEA